MAIALVQESDAIVTAAGAVTLTFLSGSNVTEGNSIIVCVSQESAAARTYSIKDNVESGSNWFVAAYNPSFYREYIFCKANCPAGINTITISPNTGTSNCTAGAAEFSGFGTTITPTLSGVYYQAASDYHQSVSGSGLTAVNDCLAVCVGCLNSDATETFAGANFTELKNGWADTRILYQYGNFSSGNVISGAWYSTGTDRTNDGCMVLLEGAAAPPAGGDKGMQINIGDSWKNVSGAHVLQINIGDSWKDISGARINIGDSWKSLVLYNEL